LEDRQFAEDTTELILDSPVYWPTV